MQPSLNDKLNMASAIFGKQPAQAVQGGGSGGGSASFTETDPTVPEWAKQPSKPSYTASEVGAIPKNGGTVTGKMVVQAGGPQLTARAGGDGNPFFALSSWSTGGYELATKNDDSNYYAISVSAAGTNINNALRLRRLTDGASTYFTVLHSANFQEHVTPAKIGAALAEHEHEQYLTELPEHSHDYLPLSGGTMQGELVVNGGAAAGDSKIVFATGKGRITNSGTLTIFGFNSSTELLFGNASYKATIRGKDERPTYNGNSMALQSDIPTNKETWTFTLEDGSTVTRTVYVE